MVRHLVKKVTRDCLPLLDCRNGPPDMKLGVTPIQITKDPTSGCGDALLPRKSLSTRSCWRGPKSRRIPGNIADGSMAGGFECKEGHAR